ncbi:MAG TPA: glycoside hydrolase family 15 protein [Terriglobales bacterium]|nr:glycoside hydrolase family 15 protein [Terriglobales bacterium]
MPNAPSSSSAHNWPSIGDYALIGDSRSAALVLKSGAIEWLCWPRFDSAAIFAALLDRRIGGSWAITPIDPNSQVIRRYVAQTSVLETTFNTESGTLVLTDFMPAADEHRKLSRLTPDREIIRIAECTRGEVELDFAFHPRANYGESDVTLRQSGKLGIRFEVGRGVYWLRTNLPLDLQPHSAFSRVKLKRGERIEASLTYSEESPVVLPILGERTNQVLNETVEWWQRWSSRIRYDGAHRDDIVRSAITLKLLTYAPSGAVIAAPTTSLPEQIGGSLNWDYRYCWLRDASMTARAFLGLGLYEEADSFIGWLMNATHLTQPELRVLYTVFGNDHVRERELDHLSGYRNSRPVRIGNAAHNQLQLDVYGEVLDAAAQYAFHRGSFDRSTQAALIKIGRYVASHWNQPDEGIWEPRGGRRNHTHSRVLCWTALDRLVTLSERGNIPHTSRDLFRRERNRIADEIRTFAWHPKRNSYVSTLGGNDVDAALLLMSYYGFESADSSRMQATYRAIRNDLRSGDHLLYRYASGPTEGAFGICSFWETDFLALGGGSLHEAQNLMDDLLKYQNDVGLYAEEIDPRSGEPLGNFPQAFTHIGLISAALSLNERVKGARQLAHRKESTQRQAA